VGAYYKTIYGLLSVSALMKFPGVPSTPFDLSIIRFISYRKPKYLIRILASGEKVKQRS